MWGAVSSASLCTRKTGWSPSLQMDGPRREWAGLVGAEILQGRAVVGGKPALVRSWPLRFPANGALGFM